MMERKRKKEKNEYGTRTHESENNCRKRASTNTK